MSVIVPSAVVQAAAPVASNGSHTVEPGAAIDVTLVATDGDGDTLDYIITSLPTKGSLSVGPDTIATGDLPYTIAANDNDVIYTADDDEHGTDTFQFKANDGSTDSNAATVSVAVNLEPTQVATTFFTEPNTAVTIALPAEDADEDTLTFSIETVPGHGTLKIGSTTLTDDNVPYATSSANVVYTPDTAYHGPDSFTFTASDDVATGDTLITNIEVNTTPVPDDLSIFVLPNESVTIELTSTDADKDAVVYVIVSLPTHGTLTTSEGPLAEPSLPFTLDQDETTVNYAVDPGYLGTDSFHYRVQDGVSVSDRAVVAIAVNTPPVASDECFTADKNETISGSLAPTDADGDTLTVRISELPAAGTLKVNGKAVKNTTTTYELTDGAASFAYTPVTDALGDVTFQWVGNDGKEDSIAAEVTMTFADPNADDTTPDDTPDDQNDPPPDDGSDDQPTDWTPDDEEVSADTNPPGGLSLLCGTAGAAEMVTLPLALLLVGKGARRRHFRAKMPMRIV